MIGTLPRLSQAVHPELREFSGPAEHQLAEVARVLVRSDFLRPEHWTGDTLSSIERCTSALVPEMRYFAPTLHFGIGPNPFDGAMRYEHGDKKSVGAICIGRTRDMEYEVVTLKRSLELLRPELLATALFHLECAWGLDVYGPNRARDDVRENHWGGEDDDVAAVAAGWMEEEYVVKKGDLDAEIPLKLIEGKLDAEALSAIASGASGPEVALAQSLLRFPNYEGQDLHLQLEELEPARVLVTLEGAEIIPRFFDDYLESAAQSGANFGWGRWFSLKELPTHLRAAQTILTLTAAKDSILSVLQAIEDGAV